MVVALPRPHRHARGHAVFTGGTARGRAPVADLPRPARVAARLHARLATHPAPEQTEPARAVFVTHAPTRSGHDHARARARGRSRPRTGGHAPGATVAVDRVDHRLAATPHLEPAEHHPRAEHARQSPRKRPHPRFLPHLAHLRLASRARPSPPAMSAIPLEPSTSARSHRHERPLRHRTVRRCTVERGRAPTRPPAQDVSMLGQTPSPLSRQSARLRVGSIAQLVELRAFNP